MVMPSPPQITVPIIRLHSQVGRHCQRLLYRDSAVWFIPRPNEHIIDSLCASGCLVECRICKREVAGSNVGRGYFAPRSTQPSIPPGTVNEYQLSAGKAKAGIAHSACG